VWRQPKAVWAVAFASVVAFMGIGLVDPILKPIADNLDASPSQVSLLFTSYMAVMGVAWLAGVLGETFNAHLPFWVGAGAVLLGAGVMVATRPHLTHIDDAEDELTEAAAVTVGSDG
jgi:ACDE family multidrug resistance protein